jgi:biopolymer transport protein ExbD
MARRASHRRRIPLTSLIDVIFLLLLFFMLSSTFSDFGEVEIAAAAPAGKPAPGASPAFLQLSPLDLRLNGERLALSDLPNALGPLMEDDAPAPLPVLVSLRDGVDSQRLTDLLVTLRDVPHLSVSILDAQ